MILLAAALPDIPALAEAGIGLTLFAILAAVAWHTTQQEAKAMSQTDSQEPPEEPKTATETAFSRVRGGIIREYKLLPSPQCRMEFLQFVRAQLVDLYADAGDDLYRQQQQSKAA